MISIDTLNEASELLLFALHELLSTRIINFPVVSEAESEVGLVYALKTFLYPITMSASHSSMKNHFASNGDSAEKISQLMVEPTEAQNANDKFVLKMGKIRLIQGHSTDGTINFKARTNAGKPNSNQYEELFLNESFKKQNFFDKVQSSRSQIQKPRQKNLTIGSKFHRPLIEPLSNQKRGGRLKDFQMRHYSPTSKYTGKSTDRTSLARHQQVYYANANICGLNAQEAFDHLLLMFENQSITGNYYWEYIRGESRHIRRSVRNAIQLAKEKQKYLGIPG